MVKWYTSVHNSIEESKTLFVLISFKSPLISFKRYLSNAPFNVQEEWLNKIYMRCYATVILIFPLEIKKFQQHSLFRYLQLSRSITSCHKIIVYYLGIEIDEKLIRDVNVPKSPSRHNIQYEVVLNIG